MDSARKALRLKPKRFWVQQDTIHFEAVKVPAAAGIDVETDRCIMVDHRRFTAQPTSTASEEKQSRGNPTP